MADNQIALLARAPVFDTPFESQTKALQLRQLMNQGQTQDMQLQQSKQDFEDQQSNRAALQADPTMGKNYLASLAQSGNYKGYAAAQKTQLDADKTRAETGHLGAQTAESNGKALNEAFTLHRDQINTVNDPASAAQWVKSAFNDPVLGPLVSHGGATAEDAIARIPTDPAGFAKWKMQAGLNADQYVKQTSVDANTAANNATSIANNTATNATTQRGQNMTAGTAATRLNFDQQQPKGQVVQSDNGTMLVDPRTGSAVPVTANGQPLQKPLKDIPASINTAIIANSQSLAQLNKTISLLEGNNVSGQSGDKNATGFKGYLPQQMLNAIDPQGIDARAGVADIGSLKLHDRSGAAVTASESPRLMPFIPTATDSNETALKKLKRLKQEVESESDAMGETYSKEQGYRPNPVLSRSKVVPAATASGATVSNW